MNQLSKKDIKKFALQKLKEGAFSSSQDNFLEQDLLAAIDRFSHIAYEFRNSAKILDVGSGSGLLLVLLKLLGHDVYGVGISEGFCDELYERYEIPFKFCNIEADPLPFQDSSFDAVSCCQVFEHFTHSHLPPLLEIKRVLKVGGILEIDVPNAVCLRNRLRMLKGKHITWDYQKHYLFADPVIYNGREFYPGRHNREFTFDELSLLLKEAKLRDIKVDYLESIKHRFGVSVLVTYLSKIKYSIPGFRKSLIAFAIK